MPASVGLVKEVRDELRAGIRWLDHRMGSFEHRMHSFDHKLDSFKDELSRQIEGVMAIAHRTQVLVEEQRTETRPIPSRSNRDRFGRAASMKTRTTPSEEMTFCRTFFPTR